MWPWSRSRVEAEKARKQLAEAQRKAKATEERDKVIDKLIGQSMATSARLRREIARNGFSDLMQQAWGGR